MELKFNPEFRVNGEYLSQIDSILLENFEIDSQYRVKYYPITLNPGQILVPPVTQYFRFYSHL